MGLRAGLDWCGKSRPTGIRSPNRPSLYRLRYPALVRLCSEKGLPSSLEVTAAKNEKEKSLNILK